MIELFASSLTLLCVWLTTKKNLLSWPIGIIATILYSLIFFNVKLYADFFLQIIFFIQSLYGWFNWSTNKQSNSKVVIQELNKIEIFKYFILFIVGWYSLFKFLTIYTEASIPFIDSQLAVLCIIANWLLSKRIIQNWIIWIYVDFIYIFLYYYKELYISSGLYLILLFLAINGYINWKNIKNE